MLKEKKSSRSMSLTGVVHLFSAASIAFGALLAWTPASAQTTIKIGSPSINDSIHHWMRKFEEGVESASNGEVEVELYPASQLGAVPRMIEGMQLGSIEMASFPVDFLTGVDKRFSVISAPGLFENANQAFRAIHDPAFVDAYWSLGESKGLKMLGIACDAFPVYVFNAPVEGLEGFKGRKIRVFSSPLEVETLRRLGATPAPMPLNEVQPALQQGVIDGAKSGPHIAVAQKWQDVAKHMVRTNESLICSARMASKAWFDQLPEGVQSMIIEETADADVSNQEFNIQFENDAYKTWQDTGGVLVELAPEARAQFREDMASVGEVAEKDDPAFQEMLKLLKEAVERNK